MVLTEWKEDGRSWRGDMPVM